MDAEFETPPGPVAVNSKLSGPLYPVLGVYLTFIPAITTTPCAAELEIAKLVATPVTTGVMRLLEVFAVTLVLLALATGAGGITVIVRVAAVELPPGPVAVTPIESDPL